MPPSYLLRRRGPVRLAAVHVEINFCLCLARVLLPVSHGGQLLGSLFPRLLPACRPGAVATPRLVAGRFRFVSLGGSVMRAHPARLGDLVGGAGANFPAALSRLHPGRATGQLASGAASSRPGPHRCPVAPAALAAAAASAPCLGAGTRLPENRVQAPSVPIALVIHARGRQRPRGHPAKRDAIARHPA